MRSDFLVGAATAPASAAPAAPASAAVKANDPEFTASGNCNGTSEEKEARDPSL
jgi:hypothetical protein